MLDLRYFGSDTDYDCAALKNKTNSFITSAYSGIPETLILNVISWILLIILFTTLRHQAGDYGRLALVNANASKKRWTEIFYSRGSSVIEQREQEEHQRQQLYNNQQDASTSHTNNVESPRPSVGSNAMDSTPLSPIHYDQGLLSWIIITFKLKKQQILLHTGPDAVHYLSFQQHLMIVMAIVTVVSLVVILPVNFLNGSEDNEIYDVNSFARTTMANLSPDSSWLWVHVIVCIIYVPLTVLIMRRASGRNAFKKSATRTIMITNISSNDRNKAVIRNYMQDLFPDVRIEDVQIAYNISKLAEKHNEYERVLDARIYCEQHRDRDSIQVKPDFCSCHKEKAYEYYQREERTLFGDVARLKASALNEPLGIAFLTVSTVLEAQNIVSHFTAGTYRQWHLTFAPSPDDIFWENLNVSKSHWYIKWSLVNIILFVVLFFLTTPAIVITLLYNWHIIDNDKNSLNPVVSEFLPTIMLWTLSALMPVIVAFSDKWLAHYTRSLQNYAIMTKCFGYLLLMILILPSLGLTSADALLRWSISEDPQRWKCFFLPDRGSFYCNYVITAAFIGTSLELMRFPELIVYIWELIKSKSKAETYHIRKSILIEFPFGTHYAWTTLVFTISMVYSVFCPLIMPFAMVYICFKHFVDRYNLYFAYGPSNMISRNGGKIHSTAVTMTKFALVLLLLIMAMISFIRGSGSSTGSGMARAIILIIALIITLTLFTFMSPIKKCTQARRPSIVETTGPAPVYVPEVLLSRSNSYAGSNLAYREQNPAHPNANNGYGGYGSDSVSDFDISSQYSANSVEA